MAANGRLKGIGGRRQAARGNNLARLLAKGAAHRKVLRNGGSDP